MIIKIDKHVNSQKIIDILTNEGYSVDKWSEHVFEIKGEPTDETNN